MWHELLQTNGGYCAGSNRTLIWTRRSRHSSPAARETCCNTACEGSYHFIRGYGCAHTMHFVCACNPSSYLSDMRFSQHQARYVDISKIAGVLGQEVSKALLGLYAFTGCDSVSAFAGIGKARPLKLLRSKNKFQVMFQNLGEQWYITEELCVQLESFVCAMYGMKKGNQDVNHCQYEVFCSKKVRPNHINYHLVATVYTITAREPITRPQSGRTHSPTTKFLVRLARDGI